MCNLFFDANLYASVFSKKALKKPHLADMWLASWRDSDGDVRHDPLYKAKTNNQAEYGAMLMALYHVRDLAHQQHDAWILDATAPWLKEVTIYGDSQLVIYQLNGQYKVKDEDLKSLWLEAVNLVHVLAHEMDPTSVHVKFVWVPREVNNKALGLEDKHNIPKEDEVSNVEGHAN